VLVSHLLRPCNKHKLENGVCQKSQIKYVSHIRKKFSPYWAALKEAEYDEVKDEGENDMLGKVYPSWRRPY
jgi:hypothetical protein